MPNIGDTLEEARKRQGISVREAAEATKIRSDFLLCFENNEFDFDMPEVYRRGFLKLYTRFLKLDVEKMMTDYNAVLLGTSQAPKRDNREFFGRMDLPEEEEKPLGKLESTPTLSEARNKKLERGTSSGFDAPANPIEQNTDKSLYWKIGLVVAGTFIILALLAMLMNAIISPSTTPDETVVEDTTVTDTTDSTPSMIADAAEIGDVKIIATGDTRVIVRQEKDGTKLFSGPLSAGQEINIERDGVIRVVSPEIQNVTIEINGERFKSSQSGLRQSWYGMDGPVAPQG